MDRHLPIRCAAPRRTLRWAFALAATCLACGPLLLVASRAIGQPPDAPLPEVAPTNRTVPADSLAAKLHRRGDLTLRDATLTEAIFSISETWSVNVVVGEVDGRVNGVFTQATLAEILDAILLTNGYSYRPVGQSLVIMRIAELGDANPLFETAIIPLQHAQPSAILNAISVLSSPRGKVHAIDGTKSLLVIDFPEKLQTIRDRTHDLDEAVARAAGVEGDANHLNVAYFTPQYVRVDTIKDALLNLLSEHGKLATIPQENRIVVTDYDHKLRQIGRAVEQLDAPRPQVRIAAMIYDIGLHDMERLGINWSHDVQSAATDAVGIPEQMWAVDAITTVAPAVGAANGTMAFLSMSEHFNLRSVVHALQSASDSRLLADPNVTVIDNETAMMAVVREIPYQQLTQTGEGGNIGTTAFREAGIKLEVTPHIAADGTIAMEVTPSFSRLVGFTQNDNQPIIDRREAKTRVRVANGRTLVIGGLRQRQDIGDFNGIPGLKDMKHFGKLFRSRYTSTTESELVVFITPYIVPRNHLGRPREQAAFDTGECWLDRIPEAVGCPPLGECSDCEVAPAASGGQSSPRLPEPIGPGAPTSGETHRGPLPYQVARDGNQIAPTTASTVAAARPYPQMLPTVNRNGAKQPPATPQDSGPEPLRIEYARRFRDEGSPQRESPAAAAKRQKEFDSAKQEPGVWERLFRF